MKKYCTLFLLIIYLQTAVAQNNNTSLFNRYKTSDSSITKEYYCIIQLQSSSCKTQHGMNIIRQINDTLLITNSADINKGALRDCIKSIAWANDLWKRSPAIENMPMIEKQNQEQSFTILAKDVYALINALKNKGVSFSLLQIHSESNGAVIRCKPSVLIKNILPETLLIFADAFVPARTDEIIPGYNRTINNLNASEYYYQAADGHNIILGIKENKMSEKDIDLQLRIQTSPIAAATTDNHAATIATLAGGAGNSFYTGKGPASRSNFFPSSFANLFADSSALLLQRNVTVQNHSYGTVIQSFYGAEAVSYDVQTAANKRLLHVFSSGNGGTSASTTGAYSGIPGFANLTGNFKAAKNIITVAATDTSNRLTAFSSSGPLYDGRMAPQVAALGPNGTSEAAAIVSGVVAVLQQVYKDSNAQALPPASLTKAILYNTCDDIGNTGIDYNAGFGMVNEYEAIKCLQQKHYDSGQLTQTQTWTRNISIPPQAANLKLTLCWTDTAAQVNTNRTLTNDLDIELTNLTTGTSYRPWVLSSIANADSLKRLPVRRRDSLNTAEQISVDMPAAGDYQIKVSASRIATTQPQAFHIAYGWDTLNRLQFTSPLSAADIDRDEYPVQSIRWRVALADTNAAGNIDLFYNDGQSWQNIANGVALKNKKHGWVLPDTTAIAQIRMQTAFGNFFSPRFLLSPVSKLKVDYLCADSLRLSWKRNRIADQYELFALRNDTAFIKPVLTTKDTFVVLQRSNRSENIYAMQPLIGNGLQAARSIAINVLNQGADCYYNTLLATPNSDAIALTLQLSFPYGIDSIHFEKTNANGTLANVLQKVNGTNGQRIYNANDAAPVEGTNYYRAALWVSGRVIYTEIVSVRSTGQQPLIIFPNPVRAGSTIQFLMRESAGEGALQLFDASGRIIRTEKVLLSGTISTFGLPAGMYQYRLLQRNGNVLKTGKLLVL